MNLVRPSVVAVALVLSLGACGADPGPDASHAGQIDYACALADHVAAGLGTGGLPSATLERQAVGREVLALTTLVGGPVSPAQEHPELADAARHTAAGLNQVDEERLQEGLALMEEQCAGLSSSAEVDVTDEGQVRYACVLTDHVRAEHGAAATWGQDDSAWDEVAAVSELLGGSSVGRAPSGPPGLTEPARSMWQGRVNLDPETVQAGLDDLAERCDEL